MVAPKIPLPGKVVTVVEGTTLKKVALISVEEHVSNCAAFLKFVSPDEDRMLKDALLFHDIGKKLFRVRRIYRNSPLRKWSYDEFHSGQENVVELLAQDYTAAMRPDLAESLREKVEFSAVADAYLEFVGIGVNGKKKAEGVKAYPVREQPDDQKSPVVMASYRLERPFGNHAAPIKVEHLPEGLQNRDRLAALIRLHHSFQVPSIVSGAAGWRQFPEYLYRLMTLDHLGSSWAERLVLLEEGGSKRTFPAGVDFGEVESYMEGEHETAENPDQTKTIRANLRLSKRHDREYVVPFSVTYFVREVNYVDPSLRK